MSQSAVIVAMVGSKTAKKTNDPTDILNSVCREGWELVTGSFVFVQEGQQSRDKFMSSGQNVAVKGQVLGYDLFKRAEQNKRATVDPWEQVDETGEVGVVEAERPAELEAALDGRNGKSGTAADGELTLSSLPKQPERPATTAAGPTQGLPDHSRPGIRRREWCPLLHQPVDTKGGPDDVQAHHKPRLLRHAGDRADSDGALPLRRDSRRRAARAARAGRLRPCDLGGFPGSMSVSPDRCR
jgi:hypothetical protein